MTDIFIDIQAISSVVGHVKRESEWAIIDHRGDLAQTVFVDPDLLDDD